MTGVPAGTRGAACVGVARRVDGGVCVDDVRDFFAGDFFGGIGLTAARFGRGVGAISMSNIFARSSLASTFVPAGPERDFERSDPAFAIRSR